VDVGCLHHHCSTGGNVCWISAVHAGAALTGITCGERYKMCYFYSSQLIE
jgi:hypothetical protein